MLRSPSRNLRLVLLVIGVLAALAVVITVRTSLKRSNDSVTAESNYITQNVSKAVFVSQGEFRIRAEQDEDAPLKIIDATVHAISGDQYHELTSLPGRVGEVVSVPRVVLENVSDKTIVGIGLMISDKSTNIKQGIYIKDQSIKPYQRFTIVPESFVRVGGNPAANPKFWLDAVDKTQVVVRVVAFFEDGSMWANRDQRY